MSDGNNQFDKGERVQFSNVEITFRGIVLGPVTDGLGTGLYYVERKGEVRIFRGKHLTRHE